MYKELVLGTLIRFSIQTGKYVSGFIKDICENPSKKSYVITYQKQVGYDKVNKRPLVKNQSIQSTKMLVIQLGSTGIFQKPRRVQISHVSNGPPSEKEFHEMFANF